MSAKILECGSKVTVAGFRPGPHYLARADVENQHSTDVESANIFLYEYSLPMALSSIPVRVLVFKDLSARTRYATALAPTPWMTSAGWASLIGWRLGSRNPR